MNPKPELEEGSLVRSPFADGEQPAYSFLTGSVAGFIEILMDTHSTGATMLIVEIAIQPVDELRRVD
jgi:hypothetical protein